MNVPRESEVLQWPYLVKSGTSTQQYSSCVATPCHSSFILFGFFSGLVCQQNGSVKHNLIAALGSGGWHGSCRFLSHRQALSFPPSVLSSSGENGGLWENSKKSVFSKRPLPLFPCISIHSLHGPTINPLFFCFFPQCLAVCSGKEKSQVIWGQKKKGGGAEGGEREME